MPGTPFRLNRSGLVLALISAAFAGQTQAAAGRVEFAVGPATVVGTDGRSRPAARGMELDTGDTVLTNAGRVQMRMTDGAYISLQPNTEFGIKDYKFGGRADGSENAFYSLLKGAMRTVTGLIGRVNRDKYLVSTPTATVGIRGTGGVIEVLQDGGTLVQGTSGIWFLANPAGTIDVPAGVSGVAPADPSQPPQETTSVPTSGPAPLPPQQEFVQGNQTEPGGTTVITPPLTTPVLLSGGGYMASMFFDDSAPSFPARFDFYSSADVTFNFAGQMTSVTELGFGFYALGIGGSHADFGTDGILAWGRWIGPVTGDTCGDNCVLNENYPNNRGFHYVVGLPTPVMPATGQATYALIGATQPTYIGGGTGTLSGNLFVDFGALTVGLNLNVAMPDTTYLLRGDALITSGTPLFFGGQGQGTVSVSGGGCFSGCDALVAGFFSGPDAARAGLGYHINDFGNFKEVVGTAAFTKQ